MCIGLGKIYRNVAYGPFLVWRYALLVYYINIDLKVEGGVGFLEDSGILGVEYLLPKKQFWWIHAILRGLYWHNLSWCLYENDANFFLQRVSLVTDLFTLGLSSLCWMINYGFSVWWSSLLYIHSWLLFEWFPGQRQTSIIQHRHSLYLLVHSNFTLFSFLPLSNCSWFSIHGEVKV